MTVGWMSSLSTEIVSADSMCICLNFDVLGFLSFLWMFASFCLSRDSWFLGFQIFWKPFLIRLSKIPGLLSVSILAARWRSGLSCGFVVRLLTASLTALTRSVEIAPLVAFLMCASRSALSPCSLRNSSEMRRMSFSASLHVQMWVLVSVSLLHLGHVFVW